MRSIGRVCFAVVAFFLLLSTLVGDPPLAEEVPDVCLEHSAFNNHPNKTFVSKALRGFNLPNWDRKNPNDRPDWRTLIALKHEGFSHIRLPFFHDAFVQGSLNGQAVQAYLDWMVRDVERLNLIGYAVSLDAHLPISHVGVELLNEPDIADEIWQTALPNLVQSIRFELPKHTIIVSPSGPQRHEVLFSMTPVEDKNVLYAVHYYDPFFFTHQGADWLENRNRLARDNQRDALLFLERHVQEPWNETVITKAFQGMRKWSEKTGRMLLVNEFGVLSHHVPGYGFSASKCTAIL